MDPADISAPADASPASPSGGETSVRLRLYVARSTPNSVRAEHNLAVVLGRLRAGPATPELEIIDVFSQSRRAVTEGVVVTPTLIGLGDGNRLVLMGDLADQVQLQRTLEDFIGRCGP